MSEKYFEGKYSFEQNYRHETAHETAEGIQRTTLALAEVAMELAGVDRVPRYTPERRENDAEHSYMLALIASAVAAEHFPEYDSGLICELSIVHELLELVTGDVATFNISNEALMAKTETEHLALDMVCERLPKHTALLLRVYTEQQLPEARFVRFIDKTLPVLVDILGPGSQVMHEDYNTHTREQLDAVEETLKTRFETMFPDEALAPIHIARNGLARKFAEVFTPHERVTD